MKKDIVSFEGVHCANCSTPMQGEFCHDCGQSIHTVLRPMHHMVEDTLDMVLHVDGRVIHTIPPLFFKPGFLTLEYFSGRRQRYVAPFRLMFVLALLAFFVCHLVVGNYDLLQFGDESSVGTGQFAQDTTPEAVHAHFEQMRQDIEKSKGQSDQKGKHFNQLITTERDHANHRLAELHAPAMPEVTVDDDITSTRINIPWLPDAINQRLDHSRERFVANVKEMSQGGERARVAEERVMSAVFHALPQTLFVLMPLFALLLKFTYFFKRRLYMEHLIVALHSHAFLFLSLLLGLVFYALLGWLTPHAAWLGTPLRLLLSALWIWALVYLLLMQKRVYRQGWFMTIVKYLFVGWCYTIMASIALGSAAILGMTN